MDFVSTAVLGAEAVLGLVFFIAARSMRRGKRRGPKECLRSVTKWLFVTTQIFALAWVSVSYAIAAYATVRLAQPFPVVELSQQAITTILGVNALKVLENIFEHNEGPVFGTSTGPDHEEGGGVL